MAHEITVVDGFEAAAFANQPAWHGLGHVFAPGEQKGMTSEIAMEKSSLDGEYSLEGIGALSDGKELPSHLGVYFNHKRLGIRHPVWVVGGRYQVYQPKECFRVMDGLVQDGVLRYESAFALQGYRKIVLLARMPGFDTFAEGDRGFRYIAAHNSYDTSEELSFMPTTIREVCANTKSVSVELHGHLAFNIRHSGDMDAKVETAMKYISQFDKGFTLYRDKAQLLATRKFSKDEAKAYLETLFPAPKDKDGKVLTEGRAFSQHENVLKELRAAYRNPTNVIPSIKDTWWALYNTVSFKTDHPVRKFRGNNDRQRAENQYLNVMNGPLSAFKDEAFKLACEMAGVALAA
jgi:phage/plasmid-like protein (TIGR03299 family)